MFLTYPEDGKTKNKCIDLIRIDSKHKKKKKTHKMR